MPALKVYGRAESAGSMPELARGLPAGFIRPRHSATLHFDRGGEEPLRLDADPEDVVELEMQDGLRIWVRVEDLESDFGLPTSRGAGDDAIALPTSLQVGGARARGGGAWAIKALKVFGIDIAEEIATFVSRHVEGKLTAPGLQRCTLEGPEAFAPPGKIDATGPTLVFLHGTGTSTAGSFGGLWDGGSAALIRRIFKRYDGRVLALQHRTLTESPVQNAIALVKSLRDALPAGAAVHIVSHSRGGLVGELLARGMRVGSTPFDEEDDLVLFERSADEQKDLRTLGKLLERAELNIERFVRVACPARGTTLADRRLDRYFSVITNGVGMITGLKDHPVYDGLTSLVAGVLKKRTDPAELPGLEAMMPDSPLVRMLNRLSVRTRADLHVLGGDLEGEGIWGRLKALATDFFYLEDHDLVVNTRSMFGGIERESVRYWIDTGGSVNHFNYFRNPDTSRRVAAALEGAADGDFHPFVPRIPGQVRPGDYQKRAVLDQPILFLLPGIMGSTLSAAKTPVWMDLLSLARGGLKKIAAGSSGIAADGLLDSGYGEIAKHLARTHHVIPFPYDWRLPLTKTGKQFGERLLEALDEAEAAGVPVRILAHSMGGLVVRTMLATDDGRRTWDRMCRNPGARLVMLGTPNGGSHAIAALLLGRDALARKLALLDIRSKQADLLQVIAGFDGVLDLLPHDTATLDLLQRDSWERLYALDVPADKQRGLFSSAAASSKSAGIAWAVPDKDGLAAAREVRSLLAQSPIDAERMIYVAGKADQTACAVRIDETARAGRRVEILATTAGDGRVPWATGIPEALQSRTYYTDVIHGDLASTPRDFPAIEDLLSVGHTTKLSRNPPVGRAAAGDVFVLRTPAPETIPDAEDLVATALGASDRRREAPPAPRVRARIVHGNLARARSPVLLGHYEEDVLVSAEAYLDRQLKGRLSRLHALELYPGPLDTATVVLNDPEPCLHPGAIVVGLGPVGGLTPATLLQTLTHGLVAYGVERLEWETRRNPSPRATTGTTISAPVTMVLVGASEGGVALDDALLAILRAVAQANDRLRAAAVPAFIDSVDILELYQDRAIEAAHALRRLADTSMIRDHFLVEEQLHRGAEGQVRASYAQAPGWWQRVRITGTRGGALRFEAITQRARADARVNGRDRRTVDMFLRRADASSAAESNVGAVLFEMLVPPDFKHYAPERQRLALMLDRRAAALPWELLHDAHDRGSRPLSVETGMIRQLLLGEGSGRRRPDARGHRVLVIGNPQVTDRRFPSLPAAKAEADAVAACLTRPDREAPTLLAEGDAHPEAVLEALHDPRCWRILHIAAHGVYQFRPTPRAVRETGVVLDDGVFLSPAHFAQMRNVPELVFINCCHLGKEDDAERRRTRFHRLAANVGEQFIALGARAVIAAGWAVHDEAARDFAETFYTALYGGLPFGEAVRTARQQVYADHPRTNTWGAYQCYGDPAYTLEAGSGGASRGHYVSPQEFAVAVENLAAEIASSSPGRDAEFAARLTGLLSGTRPEWRTDPTVCAALGKAYGAIGDLDEAIRSYGVVGRAERAGGLVAVEQQANFMARQAAALLAGSGTPGADHVEKAGLLFSEAQTLLEALVRIGPTAERKSLLGSLHKRRARGQAGADRQRSLQAMIDAYGEAAKLGAGNAWYPLLNEVSGLVAATWAAPSGGLGAEARKTIAQRLARLQEMARDQDTSQCDFWESAFRADLALVDSLWNCDLVERRLAIEKAYGDAIRRGREVREQRSILDQIAFFIAMADGAAQVDQALKDTLKQLQESLRILVGEPQAAAGETAAAAPPAAGAPPRKKRKGSAKRRRPARRRL